MIPFGAFLLRRLVMGLITLVAVSIIIFAATQALPSDPARAILGRDASPESLRALREQLDLNRPVVQQYLGWAKGILSFDLGTSLSTGQPVAQLISDAIVNSAFLMLAAAVISIPVAIGFGVASAVRRDSWFDISSSLMLLVLTSLPEFIVGIGLVLVLGTVVLPVLPPVALVPPGGRPWEHILELILPIATLSIVVVPYIARFMRASMIEVLESEYIEMARLSGLPERTVSLRHALPNALAPSIQAIALVIAYLAGGIVAVEVVFGYPGIGAQLVNAVANRDMPVAQAISLLIAAMYVVVNLLADIATILVSPRVRTTAL